MSLRCIAFLLVALLLLASGAQAESPGTQHQQQQKQQVSDDSDAPVVEAVASVTYSSGRNRVRRADTGRLERLVTETELHAGDRITVAHGGRVTLIYPATGDYRTLEPGEEHTVEAPSEDEDEGHHEDQELDRRRVNEAVLDSLRREREGSMAAVGGTRLPDDPRTPTPLFPRQTKLMPGETVTLRWEESRLGAEAWRVAVLSEGEELVSTVTQSTEWTLDAARFEPGNLYAWYVMPNTEGAAVPEPKPFFMILSEEQAALIREKLAANAELATAPDDPAPRFLDARVLIAEGLLADAQTILKELYAHSPGDTGLLERLREVYTAQRYSPRQVESRIDTLRRAHPEFAQPRNMELAVISDDDDESELVRITFTGTDHPDAHRYRLTWHMLNEAGEPQAATGGEVTLRHNPDELGTTYTVELPTLEQGNRYRLILEVLNEAGEPLTFDIPIKPATFALE